MRDSSLAPGALWHKMLPIVQCLPRGPIGRERLLSEDFKLAEDGRLSVYWIPFERLNVAARVVICGLTPGYGQMLEAFTVARESLGEGMGLDETLARVYQRAGFAGTMRSNLVYMLDKLGVAATLGVDSTAEMFTGA